MGDETKRQRYEELREREQAGALTKTESEELEQLKKDLSDAEATALAAATSRLQQENEALRAELERLESQRGELEALLERKERFLRRARALAQEIEVERRDLLDAYERITGERLRELETTQVSS